MKTFTSLSSYQTLVDLATSPPSLAKKGVLTPKRVAEYVAHGCGITLSYATERVNNQIIEALFALAKESGAIELMKQMQEGKVLNYIEGFESEQRQVLHTAVRSLFQKTLSPEASKARDAEIIELEKLKYFLVEVEKSGYTDLIQIGIGGSELGPKAICIALEAFSKGDRRVHFISNVDPDESAEVLSRCDLRKTLVVVVSKSGGTLETHSNEVLCRKAFEDAGLDPKHHFLAVTGKGSPMDTPERYRGCFYMYDYIGGRYSVTSMVGAVALAFCIGMERFLEFLHGASEMDEVALQEDIQQNLPLLGALLGIWNRNFLGYESVAIIPYSHALSRFSAHLQQLDMESNGKRISKQGCRVDFSTGPIVWGEPGTNGQHSFFQLLHQGTSVAPIQFIGCKESQYREDIDIMGTTSQEKLLANMIAQSIALAIGKESENPNKEFPGDRPSHLLLTKRLDPFTVGAILAYYEHKVAFQGFIWGINSFDQEGVQLGKQLASQIIELISQRKGEKKEADQGSVAAAYLNLIDSLENI